MAKDAPEIIPANTSGEIHPKGLLDAISYIDQNFANEMGGCMIKARFLTTKQRLEFMEVGFRSSFASGMISVLLTPLAIGVIEKYIPMFGESNPAGFDQFCALLLALSFSLGYAVFIAKTSTQYVGKYTKAMVRNLLGGMIGGAVLKAVLAFIAFHFIYFKVFTEKNIIWVISKFFYTRFEMTTVSRIYNWVLSFREIFITSSYFIVLSTLVFILIPLGAYFFAWRRNEKMFDSGIVQRPREND
jgi:hypothetical protein